MCERVVGSRIAAITLLGLGVLVRGTDAQEVPEFPTLPANHPVGQAAVQPCLTQIEGEVLCGRFRVFENRASATGRTLDLAFVVLKALNEGESGDAFTQFNGGPGVSVTGRASFFARSRAAVRSDRDILLVDHRGTGSSGALPCDIPFPGGTASRFESVFPLDHIEECRTRLSRRADLSQYTTAAAMDDLAELSSWLGYEQLDLVGYSYGTREAQVFARRHPEMVRTVVLNGVAPVNRPVYLHHARGLQDALDNMLEECRAQAACRDAYPDLERVLAQVLAAARDNPATVMVEGVTLPFGIGPLSYALRGLLYTQSGSVPARIYEASRGSWQMLADFYLQRQAWVGLAGGVPAGYHLSVLCAEDINPVTWADIARASEGSFMGDFLIGAYKRACEQWPAADLPAGYFRPVHSTAPALLLSGGRDPVTPPSGAEEVGRTWPNSVHVLVPNGGHGQGGPCVDAMVLHLIQTGSVEGADTSCVESAPPTPFEITRP